MSNDTKKNAFYVIALILSLFIAFIGIYFSFNGGPTFPSEITPPGTISTFAAAPAYFEYYKDVSKFAWGGLLFVAMILGMLANQMFARTKQLEKAGKEESGWAELFKYSVRGLGFIQGILVSPIVFYGVVKSADITGFNFALVIFSFQNGFFWSVVFAKETKSLQNEHGNASLELNRKDTESKENKAEVA